MNLKTGTVMPVATLGAEVYELEGLAFSGAGIGREMHILLLATAPGPMLRRIFTLRMEVATYKLAKPSRRFKCYGAR